VKITEHVIPINRAQISFRWFFIIFDWIWRL